MHLGLATLFWIFNQKSLKVTSVVPLKDDKTIILIFLIWKFRNLI